MLGVPDLLFWSMPNGIQEKSSIEDVQKDENKDVEEKKDGRRGVLSRQGIIKGIKGKCLNVIRRIQEALQR